MSYYYCFRYVPTWLPCTFHSNDLIQAMMPRSWAGVLMGPLRVQTCRIYRIDPKKNGRSSQVLFFYSLWHATKTWKWSCVHPHTSILMFKMFKMFKSTKFSKSLSRRRMKTPTRCRCQASPCTSPGTLPWGCGLEFKNMSIWLSKWQNGEITM